jgi:GNAT superfamily N-acetyltransferase
LRIREFTDDLAPAFHDINAEWLSSMYSLEPVDVEALRHPREHFIDTGGTILFVEAEGLGIVGTCALHKDWEREYELTKMGVLESARGRKAGEFLLRAVIERAQTMEDGPSLPAQQHQVRRRDPPLREAGLRP